MPRSLIVALVIAGILIVIAIIGRAATKKPLPVPRERTALTEYIQENRTRLERAKKMRRDYRWVKQVGRAIIGLGDDGIYTSKMSGRELMAAIYAVNQCDDDSAKNYLIAVVLTHKRSEVTVRKGKGRYAHTLEVTSGPFCSHVPIDLVRSGALDLRTGPRISQIRWF